MRFYITLLFLFFNCVSHAQNKLDSLINHPFIEYISLKKADSLGIKEIRWYSYLDKDDRARFSHERAIYSRVNTYKFKQGKLIEQSKNFSSKDSFGVDHATEAGLENGDRNINGVKYYYDKEGRLLYTSSYGVGLYPNRAFVYDREGLLVMVQYFYDRVTDKFAASSGKSVYDYYPDNGRLKYMLRLDENGKILNTEYYRYDKQNKLIGISQVEDGVIKPYAPYRNAGKIKPFQVEIDKLPCDVFLWSKMGSWKDSILLQIEEEEYILFEIKR